MSERGDGGEQLSAAERRLREHLEIVKSAPPTEVALTRRVVRSARLQRALREPLRVVGALATAVVHGLGGLIGLGREGRP